MTTQRKIGLALSGGSALGAAHVGVLEVLDEVGIRPDLIVGTSIGAVVGAAYAAGRDLAEVQAAFERANWGSFVSFSLHQSLSLFSADGLGEFIEEAVGAPTFEELAIPFRAVACDINHSEPVLLSGGDLLLALRASSALPGFFSPVEHEGRLLVDGGIIENLPVEMVREMGATYVIAVDLLAPYSGGEKPGNLFGLWQRSLHLLLRGNHPEPSAADCYLLPDLARYALFDMHEVREIHQAGRAAAEAALPQLRADLGLS